MGVSDQRHAPAVLPPGNTRYTHCIGGWVGSRTGLDEWGKSRPQRVSISGPSSPQNLNVMSRFEVVTAVLMATQVFWDVITCRLFQWLPPTFQIVVVQLPVKGR